MLKSIIDNKYQNHMLPFLWQHGEDEATIRSMVNAVKASNCGALCVESRPHPDFLGDKWWQDLDVIMDECKKLGMEVWVFDDSHFPTGYANGAAADSPHKRLFLNESHVDILGPQKGTSLLIEPNAALMRRFAEKTSDQEGVLAVVAGKRIPGENINHDSFVNIEGVPVCELVDLTPMLKDGVIYWDIPEGLWRVFTFASTHVRVGAVGARPYVNPLTKEGGRILIDTVYEPHYARYSADFGGTFRGFFSDEPTFANQRGYHAVIGHTPAMQMPWCPGMLELISDRLGEDARKYLPALWFEADGMAPKMRFAYMDVATKLYAENFCGQIGKWCGDHGVEYLGHVIEENNCHARLGNGTGHFFRALWGQHFSGIDVVLHALIPGIKGGSHAWTSSEFEADDDFFYYMLAQMAVSLAHIDPKKRGRTMCELFGAYGWQEGSKQMKWLADFMMARGVNYYIPHAFTNKAFPDPDCPPHFYAQGENPQFAGFSRLIEYMNRVCTLIDGGVHDAKAAVLYYAESEWGSGYDCMKTQCVVKELNQRQIECEILPIDVLLDADFDCVYKALVVPYARFMPAEIVSICERLTAKGVQVIFADGLSEGSSTGEIDIESLLKAAGVTELPLGEIAGRIQKICGGISCDSFQPDVKLYPYKKGEEYYCLLHNEDIFNKKSFTIFLPKAGAKKPFFYDAMDNHCYAAKFIETADCFEVEVEIEPYELKIIALSEEPAVLYDLPVLENAVDITGGEWQVSLARAKEYPAFAATDKVSAPGNLNAPDMLPSFSGIIRYETRFELPETGSVAIDLGEAHETVRLFVNGAEAGMKIAPPYRFDISAFVKAGENSLAVEVANTLVHQLHDMLSRFQAIPPSGLIGPVRILR